MSSSLSQIPLREWVNRALDSVDTSDELFSSFGADPRLLALTSDSFLASALKIAWSLADYLSQAEEQQKNNGQCQLPTPGSNWAAQITIILSSCDNGIGNAHPLSTNPQEDSITRPKGSGYETEESYLSVTSARFSPSSSYDSCCDSLVTKNQRIYSLGLVLYEIFSGGEPPIQNSSHENGKQSSSGQSGAVDLSGDLNIHDNTWDIDDIFSVGEENDEERKIGERDAKRKSTQAGDKSDAAVSLLTLKTKGIPGPLCDLIANMLDSINGDLSGDEAYSHMSEVVADLRLMLDKPDLFLHDLDIEKLSISGLQLNEKIFGMEAELASLQDSYRRAISGESQLAVISGESGTGKTVLAKRFGSYITSCGGIFLSGKFDQLQQSQPFSAVASAFNEYCNIVIRQGGPQMHVLASRLNSALGTGAIHLCKLIPNLYNILGHNAVGYYDQSEDWANAQMRLQYLLCQFVDAISSASDAAVTLFIDDLQWADSSSIEVIKQLVLTSGSVNKSKQFYFVGCCRDDEMNDDHPFYGMLSRVCCFGINVTKVNLTCMNEMMVNNMLSELLCLSPRLTRSLSNIVYTKTKGNPLFFSRLMVSLSKDGLLRLSLSRRRWEWDEEKISSRQISNDVAAFFSGTIKRLPAEVQSALCVLACFGARCEGAILKVLEAQLALSLIQPLEVAVKEGLVELRDESYIFHHDRIQEASYGMMRAEDQCLHHLKYGLALCSDNANTLPDNILFAAVAQINRAGYQAIVGNRQQSGLIANLNLLVGNKAMEMSDFALANTFFDHGISFLRKGHWQEHYDLSMRLFNGASKSAFVTGDLAALKLLSDQVLAFARSFEDKLEVLYITVCALTCSSRLSESIEKSFSILSELGEVLPSNIIESDTMLSVDRTQTMLNTITDEQLLNYKTMTDRLKIMAMKFYTRLEMAAKFAIPHLQPVITLQMVNLTISHGLSPVAPIAFTWYGMLLARRGDVRDGHRFVKIAQQLLDKVGSQEDAGEVIAIGTQVKCLVEPVQATMKLHIEGYAAAMLSGDTSNAVFNSHLHVATSFWAGQKLHTVRNMADETRVQMEQNNQIVWLLNFIPLQRTILMLIRFTREEACRIITLPGEDDLRRKNLHAAVTQNFHDLYISFVFRQYDQMKTSAESYFGNDVKVWNLIFPYAVQSFIGGLVSFWLYRQTNDPLWQDRGCKTKEELKKWADSSDWNFRNKYHLLQAEEFLSKKDFKNARISYDSAITSSTEHRFINEAALACELAGYCCLEQGDRSTRLGYFLRAHQKYHEWGALAKANHLFAFVQQNVGCLPCLDSSNGDGLQVTSVSHISQNRSNTT